jgi:hypothetical protein
LRWSVFAEGAGCVPSGAAGGARFGVLRLGEGYVPSRNYLGRGKISIAGERGVGGLSVGGLGHYPLAMHTSEFVHVLVLLAAGSTCCFGKSINLT